MGLDYAIKLYFPAERLEQATSRATAPDLPLTEDEDDRFEKLRAWRRIEAQRAQLPPYLLFHDSVLRAIARANPRSLADLEMISGLGPRKLEAHGAALLALLHDDLSTE